MLLQIYREAVMKASIIKIGNSHGIRIPKPILDQCGFKNEVEMEIHNQELILKPSKRVRENWAESFQKMAQSGNDTLLDCVETEWAEREWEWE
jgi:antitoxin MazE